MAWLETWVPFEVHDNEILRGFLNNGSHTIRLASHLFYD